MYARHDYRHKRQSDTEDRITCSMNFTFQRRIFKVSKLNYNSDGCFEEHRIAQNLKKT